MRLVVDANVLVGEVLRARGRRLLSDTRLALYVTAATWDEARHELPKRLKAVAERRGLPDDLAKRLLTEALLLAQRSVVVEPSTLYAAFAEEATWRVPQDPEDWPSVALALALDAGIWSEDRDFFGCGLATWTTSVLDAHLGREADAPPGA
jgi:predicted nucleic acid-binding protein